MGALDVALALVIGGAALLGARRGAACELHRAGALALALCLAFVCHPVALEQLRAAGMERLALASVLVLVAIGCATWTVSGAAAPRLVRALRSCFRRGVGRRLDLPMASSLAAFRTAVLLAFPLAAGRDLLVSAGIRTAVDHSVAASALADFWTSCFPLA